MIQLWSVLLHGNCVMLCTITVAFQGTVSPQCSNVRRGFHRAILLRLANDSKSDTSVPPPSYHEVHAAGESSQAESSEDGQPNTRLKPQSSRPDEI